MHISELKYGDRFIILNEGWSKTPFINAPQKVHPSGDRVKFYTGENYTGNSISISGMVLSKLKVKKVE